MRSFAERSREPEMMDAPDVTAEAFAACLADLAKVNTVTRARPPTLRWLARATRNLPREAPFTIVDVGCGEGDMLRAVRKWAVRAGLQARLIGIDLNPRSEPAAKAATDPAEAIDYLTGDVFDYAPEAPIDFVISSLVTHHMGDAEVVRFLRWMEATTRRGWFVNDLHRHPAAFYGFMALSSLAGWHPFVRHDGPVSVARAFRRQDWERLLATARIPAEAVTVDWRLPFRICVGRIK
ncbi:MAG: methyltransferase domain-containing protein [Caulobacteraceae bacterium]|nr:methyltransferase domain-containing protein [Caulobacteraceae bacterium]